MTFHSLPFEPRKVVATEARLNKIYEAAKLGLQISQAQGLLEAARSGAATLG